MNKSFIVCIVALFSLLFLPVVFASAPLSPADIDGDGCVSLGEISSYVSFWLSGSITLTQVSSAERVSCVDFIIDYKIKIKDVKNKPL